MCIRDSHWTYRAERRAGDEAVILYSGGTTGVTKGIQLTYLNFNALGKQIIATNPMSVSYTHLTSAWPIS